MARVQFSEGTKPESIETPTRRGRTAGQLARATPATIFKAQHFLVVVLFIWFLLLHVAGIFLFTKGFLLTRLVLDNASECSNPPIDVGSLEKQEKGCWYPQKFEKAVVVIIDALRYDFTVPQAQPRIYHNTLKVLHQTALEKPQNAFLLPFIADPPTTTLQRLKGLTTGSLPTFMDAGSNFAGTAIEEDNLLSQALALNKTLVHLGDDTWHQLFPGFFEPNLTHAYDSFNVWDLHTVDNGVIEHLFPHFKRSSEWDILFGHFLGVDHAGHRYGPDHPQMTAKLQHMDDVISQMIDELPNDTLLVVMGDHGMDSKGDHGGESEDEVEAALWMYSKQPVFGRISPRHMAPPPDAKTRPVAQIDLVPTLALLLGLPVPYNNLGAPIPEAFIGATNQDWEAVLKADMLTAAQVRRYQAEYAIKSGVEVEFESEPNQAWDMAMKTLQGARTANSKAPDRWRQPDGDFKHYMTSNLRLCRSLWASFDIPCMIMGVSVLALAAVVLLGFARSHGTEPDDVPAMLVGAVSGGVLGAFVGRGAVAIGAQTEPLYGTIFGAALSSLLGSLVMLARQNTFRLPLPDTIWGWLAVFVTVSQAAGFASNSYTIWEDEILLFFLGTFGLLALISSFRQHDPKARVLGIYHSTLFIIFTRLASLSRLCREEQMPYCRTTYYASAGSSTAANWHLAISYAVAVFLPFILRSFYDNTDNWHGSAVFWLGYALTIGLFGSAIYWSLNAADDGGWFPQIDSKMLGNTKVGVAQIVLFVALVAGPITFIWAPPPVKIETLDPGSMATTGAGRPKVLVSGLNNVHGSRYGILVVSIILGMVLVSKPMGGGVIALMAWQIFSLLEIVTTNDLTNSSIAPIALALLGSFHFFKTGHQATLASIQWDSAFLALRTVQYPWSPMLVVFNTWGAQVIAAAAVPLLVLWKQPTWKQGLLGSVAKASATHLGYYVVINLATSMWAGHLRRHLMLFRIFNPRFMTGAAVLMVVELITIVVSLIGFRTNMLGVTEIFQWP